MDAFDFLKEAAQESTRYDFIVLDPPAFVKRAASVKEGLRGYLNINRLAAGLLKEGGLLATSSCSYHIDEAQFLDTIKKALSGSGRSPQLRIIEIRSQSSDHPVNPFVPETKYLKCVFISITRR